MECRKCIFTHQEKSMFMEILNKYSKIIENKNNHSSALKVKNLTWQRITAEFNSNPVANLQRTPKQLRRLWMNLKQRQKDGVAKRLYFARGTMTDTASDSIHSIANVVLSGIDSSMDSDIFLESGFDTPHTELRTCLVMSEDSQNITHPENPLVREVKIEPLSPTNTYATETESTPNTEEPSLHRINDMAYSAQAHNTSNHKTEPQQASELHQLEIILLKEKIRCQQQEHKSKEERAIAIHNLEHQLLEEKLREARAKADLAELLLRRQQ